MGVTVGGNDLEDSVVDGQEWDVESSAAQVEYQHVLLAFLLVHAVCDGSGGGLVDDAHDDKTGDNSGVLGGLTLSIVEVLKNENPLIRISHPNS